MPCNSYIARNLFCAFTGITGIIFLIVDSSNVYPLKSRLVAPKSVSRAVPGVARQRRWQFRRYKIGFRILCGPSEMKLTFIFLVLAYVVSGQSLVSSDWRLGDLFW